jgi:hypothetical protein
MLFCFREPHGRMQNLLLKIVFYTFQETPESFPLPSGVAIVRADAGWAHCVAITGICLWQSEHQPFVWT